MAYRIKCPLARLSPSKQELVAIGFSRRHIEARDLGQTLGVLGPMRQSRASAELFEGRVMFSFSGRDENPFLIPGTRRRVSLLVPLARARNHRRFRAQIPSRPSRSVTASDVTARAGIAFRHVNGAFPLADGTQSRYMPEAMGSGVVAFDYDGDGGLDHPRPP